MDEIAWAAYQKAVKKSEDTRDTIIELYGEYNRRTVMRAKLDGLITDEEKSALARNCPYRE